MKKSEAVKQKNELLAKIAELDKLIESKGDITDKVNVYDDILSILGADEKKDVIKIDKFDADENKLVKNLIKKIRTVKVYNEGWLPKRGDKRWYPWYNVSSGFVFRTTDYADTFAGTTSASRLAFKNNELTRDYVKKFSDVEQEIIDIK